jgi:probable HAF family extracellular repeat protein
MQIKRKLQAVLGSEVFLLLATINWGSIAHAAIGSPPPPTPTQYNITTFDKPGAAFFAPFGPNAEGLVCGFYEDPTGAGFLWRNGNFEALDAPDWDETWPSGINDWGVVSGTVDDLTPTSHTFLYSVSDGKWSLLPDVPGRPGLGNIVINDWGTVAGSAFKVDDDGNYYDGVAWTWDGRSYSFFSVPGASETDSTGTYPFGINNVGQIVGNYTDNNGLQHAFLKDGSKITTFDVPGADISGAGSINDEGDIVGTYYINGTPYDAEQGFILHKGHFYTIPVPGYGGVIHINDLGQLSGLYWNPAVDNDWHGFVAAPKF